MRVLVDTSVWSLALRRSEHTQNPESPELRRLIAARTVEIIGPIRQEVLSGVRDTAQFVRLKLHLAAFHDLPLLTADYVAAAELYNLCRAKGIQGSNTDFLICAVALRHELAVFTTDGDFSRFAECVPLTLHTFTRRNEPPHAPSRRFRAET